jgi:7-cyano-7-deazaguanine synthase
MKAMVMQKTAVCLISGGMDSAVAAAIARTEGYEVYPVFVDYGQRTAQNELEHAKRVSDHLGCKDLKVCKFNWLSQIGRSALTDKLIEVPVNVDLGDYKTNVTYVPFRNTILLSIGIAYAETIGAQAVFSGIEPDNANPDTKVEYISAMQTVSYLGTRDGTYVLLRCPFIELGFRDKSDIIRKGMELKVPFELTHSCYKSDSEKACGKCEKCMRRYLAFINAGCKDPIAYEVIPDISRYKSK